MRVDFMIIGAQKCGTTSLAAQLAGHPDICFSRVKEPGYFHKTHDWSAGLDAYHGLFSPTVDQICGEASTMYTFLPEWQGTFSRLYAYNPHLKLVYIMRHPVDRVQSNYSHDLVRGRVKDPPEVAVFRDPAYINRSRYSVQIEPYLECFGRENVLLLVFEEYIADQGRVLLKLAEFLEISGEPFSHLDTTSKHRTIGEWYWKYSTIDSMVSSRVFEVVRASLPTSIRKAIRRSLSSKLDKKPDFSPALRQTLWRFLKDDARNIEELLGRRLDAWREGEAE